MLECRRILAVFLICTLISTVFSVTADAYSDKGSRYLRISGNSAFSYYLDTQTLRYIDDPYLDEKLIEVWIKIVCEDKGANAEIENRRSKGLSVDGYDTFSYSLRKYYLRVKERQMQILVFRDFTGTGEQLDAQKYTYAAARWDDVIPNTLGEVWYSKIRSFLENKKIYKSVE